MLAACSSRFSWVVILPSLKILEENRVAGCCVSNKRRRGDYPSCHNPRLNKPVKAVSSCRASAPRWRDKAMILRTNSCFPAALLLVAVVALSACANPDQTRARQDAAEAEMEAKDDARCRAGGAGPGEEAYDRCREAFANQRAEEGAVRAQRSESFQRTLGSGTEALSGH